MSAAEVLEPGGEPLVFSQRGSLRSFLGLSVKNGLLNLVTLTLYRFWGRTEVRRRIWSSTYLNDDAFEYSGRGVELFLGFLIALLVIGLPFLLAVFGVQFLGPATALLFLLPLYVFLFFLVGFGRFTAFRYLASRTAWRGVRFSLRGSAPSYAVKWLGYVLLSGVTLGWFWPAAARRLAAPLWDGLRFGDKRLQFDLDQARKVGVYGPYALAWVLGFVGYVGLIAVSIAAGMADQAEGRTEPSLEFIIKFYAIVLVAAFAYVVILAPYHAAMLRSVAAGIRLDDVRFRLNVRWTEVAWLSLSNILLITITLGFLTPFVQARVAKFLVERIQADGVADLSSILQSRDEGPRTGEGLADAFGISPV